MGSRSGEEKEEEWEEEEERGRSWGDGSGLEDMEWEKEKRGGGCRGSGERGDGGGVRARRYGEGKGFVWLLSEDDPLVLVLRPRVVQILLVI